MIDYGDLRKLAKGATEGPWMATSYSGLGFCSHTVDCDTNSVTEKVIAHIVKQADGQAETNALYIAAMSPAITLRLLDIIAVAKQALTKAGNTTYFDVAVGQCLYALDEIAKLEKE